MRIPSLGLLDLPCPISSISTMKYLAASSGWPGPNNSPATRTWLVDPVVGHAVDPNRGHVANHDAADLDLIPGAHDLAQIVREHPGLQTEFAGVDDADRLFEIFILLQQRDGTERFHAADF